MRQLFFVGRQPVVNSVVITTASDEKQPFDDLY